MTDAERIKKIAKEAKSLESDIRQRAMPRSDDVRWLCSEVDWLIFRLTAETARADAADAALRGARKIENCPKEADHDGPSELHLTDEAAAALQRAIDSPPGSPGQAARRPPLPSEDTAR